MTAEFSRREFVKTAAAATVATGLAAPALSRAAFYPRGGRLKVGVIGCGGRGTGAAGNILEASPDVEIYALGDVFKERIESCASELAKQDSGIADRAKVAPDRCFVGFDAYKQVLASGVDVVVLATPPHFRPIHFAAAVEAGKHIFFEKPVAVDPAGIRRVLEAAEIATAKKLCVVTGTQRRHERCYLEMMKRIQDGAIGRVVSASCYWNQGGLWMNKRQAAWSDMEWQLRNWLYFTWLSGDHIVEQHVHNLDVCNWAIGAHPTACRGMGGRQVRTGPEYGHIFDHFAIEYEYPGGVRMFSQCRQIEGCDNRVEELVYGTDGISVSASGRARIEGGKEGGKTWKFEGENPNPYVEEHRDLLAAINGGTYINEARRVAESTLTAIMGRISAYTGKTITWDQALNLKLDLSPPAYAMGPIPVPPVAVPGQTPVEPITDQKKG
jgi:predicted dehydrogenase